MEVNSLTKQEIEELEKEFLIDIYKVVEGNESLIEDKLDESLRYVEYILPPLINASGDRTLGFMAEILEKYLSDILIEEFEERGYENRPLFYSSDICLEGEDIMLHIDLKTANIENTSDYASKIPIGNNQTSYTGFAPIKIKTRGKGNGKKLDKLEDKFPKVYSNLPNYYENNGKKKLTLTYSVSIVYNEFSSDLSNIIEDYKEIKELIKSNFSSKYQNLIQRYYNEELAEEFVEEGWMSHNNYGDKLSDSYFIALMMRKDKEHIRKFLELNEQENTKIANFRNKLESLENSLRSKGIAYILCTSLPNGLLSPDYDLKKRGGKGKKGLKSGKNFGEDPRFYYGDGMYENLEDFPRVLFPYVNNEFFEEINQNFGQIGLYRLNGESYERRNKGKNLQDFS